MEEREESPYYCIRYLFEHIFRLEQTYNDEAISCNSLLCDSAQKHFLENVKLLEENPQEIFETNVPGLYTVYKKNGGINTARFTVNITSKHCGACFKWNQGEVPCYHALAVFRHMDIMNSDDFFSSKYFHPVHLQKTRQDMYMNRKLSGVLPDDNVLENMIAKGKFQPLRPVLKIDDFSAISRKRFRSEGENGKGRYISAATKDKIACPRCSKILKNTGKIHDIMACMKFANKSKVVDQH